MKKDTLKARAQSAKSAAAINDMVRGNQQPFPRLVWCKCWLRLRRFVGLSVRSRSKAERPVGRRHQRHDALRMLCMLWCAVLCCAMKKLLSGCPCGGRRIQYTHACRLAAMLMGQPPSAAGSQPPCPVACLFCRLRHQQRAKLCKLPACLNTLHPSQRPHGRHPVCIPTADCGAGHQQRAGRL